MFIIYFYFFFILCFRSFTGKRSEVEGDLSKHPRMKNYDTTTDKFRKPTSKKSTSVVCNETVSDELVVDSVMTTQKLALMFFQACRRPYQLVTEMDLEEKSRQFPDNILELRSSHAQLSMFVLPAMISKWPSFYASKQEEVSNMHLFFHRVSQTHRLRFNVIVDLLRQGKKVVSTGVSGIGKSIELNAYLMTFLANIGQEGWPKEIWLGLRLNAIEV